jgi:hypothetical protein
VPGAAGATPVVNALAALLAAGRILLVGEVHGTREMPAAFGDLVAHAVKMGLHVRVGLELPEDLSSSWTDDGRSSKAMAAMRKRVRALGVPIFGFQRKRGDLDYADVIAREASPDTIVIALMGSTHARTDCRDDEITTGCLLKRQKLDVKSVYLTAAAGSAWNCNSGGCGAHAWDALTREPGYDAALHVGAIHASPPGRP